MMFKHLCGCFGAEHVISDTSCRVDIVKEASITSQTRQDDPIEYHHHREHQSEEFLNQADVVTTPKDDTYDDYDMDTDAWPLPAHRRNLSDDSVNIPTPHRLERKPTLTFTASKKTLEFAAAASRISGAGSPILQLDDLPN